MYDGGRDRIRQVQWGLPSSTVPVLVQADGDDSKAGVWAAGVNAGHGKEQTNLWKAVWDSAQSCTCFQAINVIHGSGDCVPSLGISPPGADDDSPNYVNGLG